MFEVRSPNVAFTICARNYFAQAQVLQASFKRHHPETDFHVVLVDRRDEAFAAQYPDISITWVEDIGLPRFAAHSMRFDVIELSTNVKPHCLGLLLERYAKALYLDPDTCLFDRLDNVFERLVTASIVVTPVTMKPILDGHRPDDLEFMRVGVFNLGFVGVSSCDEGKAFTQWWSDRCLSDGFHETQLGVFVDQKWVNLAPCYFPGTVILRDPGLNMAPWNLHERTLVRVGDRYIVNDADTLKFFHFSSFDASAPQSIAKRQTRFAAGTREDLRELLDDYAKALSKAGFEQLSRLEYSFDRTVDGLYISPTLRRIYANAAYGFDFDVDPWATDAPLMQFARRRRLVGPAIGPARRVTANDVASFRWQSRLIAFAFGLTLRLLGPNRYFVLMRYLAFASSIRMQPKV